MSVLITVAPFRPKGVDDLLHDIFQVVWNISHRPVYAVEKIVLVLPDLIEACELQMEPQPIVKVSLQEVVEELILVYVLELAPNHEVNKSFSCDIIRA